MKEFFGLVPGIFHFHLFGFWHIVMSVATLLAIFLIYHNREKLRKWKYHDKEARYFIAIFMFLNMVIYYVPMIIMGTWDWHVHLPLHLCFISGGLFMITMITENRKLYKLTYFLSFLGPLPAILFPDLTCGPDRFIFWQFFISHHFFLVASLYTLYVLDYKIEKRDLPRAFLGALCIFGIMFVFNLIFGTNYIMMNKLPDHMLKLFPFLVWFDHPMIWLMGTGILVCFLAYLPVYFWNKKQEKEMEVPKKKAVR